MKRIFTFAAAACLLLSSWAASAAALLVTTEKDTDCSDLQCDFPSALNEASQNGEDDTLMVAEGVYHADDFYMGFGYLGYFPAASENFALNLEGAGAGKTVIDGDGEGGLSLLSISLLNLTSDDAASVSIKGFTFQNTAQTAVSIVSPQTGTASVVVQDCVFDKTWTDIGMSAGLSVSIGSGSAEVLRNHFLNTPAGSGRGALNGYVFSGDFTVADNVFYRNSAAVSSSAYVTLETGVLNVVNNTFLENASVCCGVLGVDEYSGSGAGTVNISNNIFWGNSSDSLGVDIFLNDNDNPANQGTPTTLLNNDVTDVYSQCENDPSCAPLAQVMETGNVSVDPGLVDPQNGDFHLMPDSPLIDQGSASAEGLPSTDFEGDARILGEAPDIGADESTSCDTCGQTTGGTAGGTTTGGTGGVAGGATSAGGSSSGGCSLLPEGNPGDLDATFGDGGLVTTSLGAQQNNSIRAIAIQTDGKIVAGGSNSNGGNYTYDLVRYWPDGSVDETFGDHGLVREMPMGQSGSLASIALQADGKILAAGTNTAFDSFTLVRFNADGTLDPFFGEGGVVMTPLGDMPDFTIATILAVQPDGKILAAGRAYKGSGILLTLVRYLPDGTPDPSFGDAGVVFESSYSPFGNPYDLAVLPDGKILVYSIGNFGVDTDFAILRFAENGSLDTSFGPNGQGWIWAEGLGTLPGGLYVEGGMAVDGQGRILAGKGIRPDPLSDSEFAVARYDADGTPDASFGQNGLVLSDPSEGDDVVASLSVDAGGKILATGFSTQSIVADNNVTYNYPQFTAVRYLDNGEEDASFGNAGVSVVDFGAGGNVFGSTPYAMALDGNGGLILAGEAVEYFSIPFGGGNSDFALARLIESRADLKADMTVDPSSPSVGQVVTYTIVVSNDGPDEAVGVMLTDELPASLSPVDASVSGGGCETGQTVVCSLGDMNPGESRTVTLTVLPSEEGTVSNQAAVAASPDLDSDASDNQPTADIAVSSGSSAGGSGGVASDGGGCNLIR